MDRKSRSNAGKVKTSSVLKKKNEIEEYKRSLESILATQIPTKNSYGIRTVFTDEKKSESILNKAKKRKEEIENDSLEQDIALKKGTLIALFLFLATETILVFLFALFQGFRTHNFSLEEWSFKLLISATIMQITYMLQLAVKHLFPNKL